MPILTTPSVISIVGIGNTPVVVPDEEVSAIQIALKSGFPVHALPLVSVGSRVVIESGPLAGIEGIALRVDNKFKLVVSIMLLQRSIAVEIDREWARPISTGTEHDRSVTAKENSYWKTSKLRRDTATRL